MVTVHEIELILTVPSIEDTLAWYERVLGWPGGFDVFGPDGKCDFGGVQARKEPLVYIDFTRYRGEAPYTNDPCQTTLLVYVDDVDEVYRRAVENGGAPLAAPAEQFWGSRTFAMRDCNGFLLNFAQKIDAFVGEELQKRYEEK